MTFLLCILALLGDIESAESRAQPDATADIVVVLGAPGTDEYGEMFRTWAERWLDAAEQGAAAAVVVGDDEGEGDDHDRLHEVISEHAIESAVPLWIVLIGHGTFDGRTAKFNLRGPDVSAAELAEWLDGAERPVAVINCASSSGPFIERLSRPGRVIVTATRSGHEVNFARFGEYLSASLTDETADLDKDGQVSLLEAFLKGSRRTEEFYAADDNRLPTEHALLDDDGDAAGTRAAAFEGVRPTRDSETGALDGLRAHQWHLIPSDEERDFPAELRPLRDELELAVLQLRELKDDLSEEDYFSRLESLLVQLAEVYEQAERVGSDDASHESSRG